MCRDLKSARTAVEVDGLVKKLWPLTQAREFTLVITAWGRVRRSEKALEMFHLMESSGLQPNLFQYGAVLRALENTGQWENCLTVLEEMKDRKVMPDMAAYNSAIVACDKAREWTTATKTLEEALAVPLKPTLTSFSSGLQAYGHQLKEIWKTLQNDEGSFSSEIIQRREDLAKKVRNLVSDMIRRGFTLAPRDFHFAANAMIYARNPDGLVEIYDHAWQRPALEEAHLAQRNAGNLAPLPTKRIASSGRRDLVKARPPFTIRTEVCRALVSACKRKKRMFILPVLLNVDRDQGWEWPISVYEFALQYATRSKDAVDAMRHLKTNDTHLYNLALRCCLRSQSSDAIRDFFSLYDDILRRKVPRNPKTFACVTEMCRRTKQVNRALDAIKAMETSLPASPEDTPAVTDAYTSAIAACDNHHMALRLVDKALANCPPMEYPPNHQPRSFPDDDPAVDDEVPLEDEDDDMAAKDRRYKDRTLRRNRRLRIDLYAIAIGARARAGEYDKAFQLFDIAIAELGPAISVYNAALMTCGKCGDVDRAVQLLEDFKAMNHTIPRKSYNAALAACTRTKQWERALQFLATMQQDGPEPNDISFSWTICACEAAGEHDKAQALFNAASSLGLYPDLWADGAVDLHLYPAPVAATVLRMLLQGQGEWASSSSEPLILQLGANEYGQDLAKTIVNTVNDEFVHDFRCTAFDIVTGKLLIHKRTSAAGGQQDAPQ